MASPFINWAAISRTIKLCYGGSTLAAFRWVWQDFLPQPVSPQLKQVLARLIAKATTKRYQSANDVLADLNAPLIHQYYSVSNAPAIDPEAQPVPLEVAIVCGIEKRKRRIFNNLAIPAVVSVSLGVALVVVMAPGIISLLQANINVIFRYLFQQISIFGGTENSIITVKKIVILFINIFSALSSIFLFFVAVFRIREGEEIGTAMSSLMSVLVFFVGSQLIINLLLN